MYCAQFCDLNRHKSDEMMERAFSVETVISAKLVQKEQDSQAKFRTLLGAEHVISLAEKGRKNLSQS